MKPFLIFTLPLASLLTAAELTIQTAPLETTLNLEASVYPESAIPFQLEPKQWTKFVIARVVDHGTRVKKDDVIIEFERDEYQRHLEESKEAAKGRQIALAKLERERADLETTTKHSLEGLKLAHDRAKEALDYFTTTGRALQIEDAKQSLDRAERSLSYQEEELKQLLKMYEEDGITEETEEIILKRQRASVESARFALTKAKESTQWALEKTIPRQAVDLRRAFEEAKLAHETGQLNLPRALQEKELAVAKAQRDAAHAAQDLLELEADGALLVLKAPADGIIYHGEINRSSWSLGGTSKFLFKSGTAPANTVMMSLVPEPSSFVLHATAGQSDFLGLTVGTQGTANIAGFENSAFPVEVTSLASAPGAEGNYGIGMSVEVPENTPLLAGMKTAVTLVTYRNEEAISVPDAAIIRTDGEPTVKLKMADGKHELRPVKTGKSAKGRTEILSGLEADQVILIPDN
jgi:multidrug efflux pump subunit AcrA (membrane-fusion protein)